MPGHSARPHASLGQARSLHDKRSGRSTGLQASHDPGAVLLVIPPNPAVTFGVAGMAAPYRLSGHPGRNVGESHPFSATSPDIGSVERLARLISAQVHHLAAQPEIQFMEQISHAPRQISKIDTERAEPRLVRALQS